MLVSFSVENWMSFKDEATFSMIAGRERQHGERLARIKKYPLRLLPVSCLYGGNASGKTNLFQALNCAKNFIVDGTRPDARIPVQPFRLDSACLKTPTSFRFEILIDETVYEFSFAVTHRRVVREQLTRITSSSERTLYSREEKGTTFDETLKKRKLLDLTSEASRPEQLFLTTSVSNNVEHFKPVHDWFRDKLVLIAPDTRFGPFELYMQEDSALHGVMSTVLQELDTGIARLDSQRIPFEDVPLPENLRDQVAQAVRDGGLLRLSNDPRGERFVFRQEEEKVIADKLVTVHKGTNGGETEFQMNDESEGSRRVIDLLPVFIDLADKRSSRVYVIDEIGRSLHTVLIRQLLERYLASCSANTRSQLLFTTHDVLLVDQDIFRRDEMWITERDRRGRSSLLSFSDYKGLRHDKDVRKIYLQGRLGGVPRIISSEAMTAGKVDQEGE